MKTRTVFAFILCSTGLLQTAHELSAAGGIVMSTPRRLAILETAEEVLAKKQTTWRQSVVDLPDPFYRPDIKIEKPATPSEPDLLQAPGLSDIQVLESVAPKIQPTGTMLIGNEHFLLLGGRRFRSGDQISVTFEGMVYRIQITSIERNSYTLRLNEQELQRDFK